MKTLLQINTSMFSDGGQSSRLAERFVAVWREAHPDGTVVVRDLAKEPVPHSPAASARSWPSRVSATPSSSASSTTRMR